MKTVAVIGATQDCNKFGNKAVRAFRHRGYDVVPINLHHREFEGLQAFQSMLDVPGRSPSPQSMCDRKSENGSWKR